MGAAMPRFHNILLTADQHTDVPTLTRTLALAASQGARLTLLDVVRPITSVPLVGISATEFQALMVEERRRALEGLAASLSGLSEPPQIQVRVGVPFIEIIRTVLAGGHDLLLRSPEGQEGSGRLFGSTDLHLLRKCPCPVWLVKPAWSQAPNRILAAVDLEWENEDETTTTLNTRILALAAALAAARGGELHVVYAWNLFCEALLHSGRADVDMTKALAQTRGFYARRLARLLQDCPLNAGRVHRHLLKGDPEAVVPALAEQEAISLIVMGTVARTGIGGLLIGNTAEKLLSRVDCSVLALKPPDFQTPVQPTH